MKKEEAKKLSLLHKEYLRNRKRVNKYGEKQKDVDLRLAIDRIYQKQFDMLSSKIRISCGDQEVETKVIPPAELAREFNPWGIHYKGKISVSNEIAAFTAKNLREAITGELIHKLLFGLK